MSAPIPDTRIRKEATGGWWVEVRRPIGKDVYRWTPDNLDGGNEARRRAMRARSPRGSGKSKQ